ncbi:hypothetical protein N3K66_007272 [Trichothecium roseum]|uniref:Uncharacterized protein n=1 Tax=Trichothecium roseum TaxID=47278 RepID=A0ACC0UTI2_9HYPO|nr:hypothetical protein N3K66_007272 [Trichothecium roseum]
MFGSTRSCMIDSGCYVFSEGRRRYIPLLKVDAHTTLFSTTSRTTLTQTFQNPSRSQPIEEVKYVFPLYEGVSISSSTFTVGDKVLYGRVKERQRAKQDYQDAVSKGQSAGLLEQSLDASDVFTTSIGHVPAASVVKVDITYLGELKYDAAIEGLRFTIPTSIVPRYGEQSTLQGTIPTRPQGFTFTMDIDMPQGCTIRSVQSPSHPMAVNIGSLSTSSKQEELSLLRGNASLSLGTTTLDKDLVLQVVVTKLGEPSAVLETHPTIPNQRALMTTLVPKFKLPQEKPEVVFVCDRSGSMGDGLRIPNLIGALRTFLQSLPVGVKFNVCSFGSRHEFLFDRSQTYSQETLDRGVRYASTFVANFGGTEMHAPLKETFKRRYSDMNLEVFLLTDGEIWNQQRVFDLVNARVRDGEGKARVFTLGVGNGVSHSLIEGIARAGRGFSQTVTDGEKMDTKVVRMLKASLMPHINDYSLEIKYESSEDAARDGTSEEFEIVEKVTEALQLDTQVSSGAASSTEKETKPTVSLFQADLSDDDGDIDMMGTKDAGGKYDHLPPVLNPRYLQTPGVMPPLFPFSRTNVYVLISDDAPNREPKSVVLRGTCAHGPLKLVIPISEKVSRSTTIHQLAAKKAIQELEEGRGWITKAKDCESGNLLKEEFEGGFSDMVEREAVRLGVKFQVSGKWCSYVAVEENGQESTMEESVRPAEMVNPGPGGFRQPQFLAAASPPPPGSALFGAPASSSFGGGGLFGASTATKSPSSGRGTAFRISPTPAHGGGLFGASAATPSNSSGAGGGLFGTSSTGFSRPQATSGGGLFGAPTETARSGGPLGYAQPAMFGSSDSSGPCYPQSSPAVNESLLNQGQHTVSGAACMSLPNEDDDSSGGDEGEDNRNARPFSGSPSSRADPLQTITSLQLFSGSWTWSKALEEVTGLGKNRAHKAAGADLSDEQLATIIAIAFLEVKMVSEEETWDMIADKAKGWLRNEVGDDKMEELFKAAKSLFEAD